MSEVKLKPCPFCGGEALDATTMRSGLPVIECIKCHALMMSPDAHGAPALANKWNTRELSWQPIETAPKDGRFILLYQGENAMVSGHYQINLDRDGHSAWLDYDGNELDVVTHWMPIPEPPAN